jgi:hypothetical protein
MSNKVENKFLNHFTSFSHSLDGDLRIGMSVLPITQYLQHLEPDSWRGKTIAEDAELNGPNSVPNANMEAINPFICIADPQTLKSLGISIKDLTSAVNALSRRERERIGQQTGFRIDDPLSQNYGLSPTYQEALRSLMFKDGNTTEAAVSYAFSKGGWLTAASTFKEGISTQFMEMDEATTKTFLRLAIATSLLPLRDLFRSEPEFVREINERAFHLGKIYYRALDELKEKIGRTPTIQEFFEYATQVFEESLLGKINVSQISSSLEEEKGGEKEGKYRNLVQLCNEYGITHIVAGDQHPGWESGVKRLAANIELHNLGYKDDPFSHLTGSFEMYRLSEDVVNNPDFGFIELTLREQEVVTETYNEAIINLGGNMRLLDPQRNDTLVFLNTELGRRELRRRKIDDKGSLEWVFVDHSNEANVDIALSTVKYIFTGKDNIYALYVNEHFTKQVEIKGKHTNLEMILRTLEQEEIKRMVGEEVAISLKAVAALPAYQYSGRDKVRKALLLPRFGSSYTPISAEFVRLLRKKLPNDTIPPIYVIRQHQLPYDALASLEEHRINLSGEYGNFLGYFLGRLEISTHEFSRNWREYEKNAQVLLGELLKHGDLKDKFEIMLRQVSENNMVSPEYLSWIIEANIPFLQASQTIAEKRQNLRLLHNMSSSLRTSESEIIPINATLEDLMIQAITSVYVIRNIYSQVLPDSLLNLINQYEEFLNGIIPVTEKEQEYFSLGLLNSMYNLSRYARLQLAQLSFQHLISTLSEANEESLRQLGNELSHLPEFLKIGRELGFSQLAYNEQNILTPEIVIYVLKRIAAERFRQTVQEIEKETDISEQILEEKKMYIELLNKPNKGLRELLSNLPQWKNKNEEEKRRLLENYLREHNLSHLMPTNNENIDEVLVRLLQKGNCYTSSINGLNIVNEIQNLLQNGGDNSKLEKLTRELIKTLKKIKPQLDIISPELFNNEAEKNIFETLKSIAGKKGEISVEDMAFILPEDENKKTLVIETFKDLLGSFIRNLNPQYFEAKRQEAEINELEIKYLIKLAEKLMENSRVLGYQGEFTGEIDESNLNETSINQLRNLISFFNPNTDGGSTVLAYDFREKLRKFQDQLENEGNLYAKINNFFGGKNPFTAKLVEEIDRLEETINNLQKEIEMMETDSKYQHDLALLKTALAAHIKVLEGMTHLSKANSRQPFATLYLLGGPRMVEEVIRRVFYTLEIL